MNKTKFTIDVSWKLMLFACIILFYWEDLSYFRIDILDIKNEIMKFFGGK